MTSKTNEKRHTWVVIDDTRIADGYYGKAYFYTRKDAERRLRMFPDNRIEAVR